MSPPSIPNDFSRSVPHTPPASLPHPTHPPTHNTQHHTTPHHTTPHHTTPHHTTPHHTTPHHTTPACVTVTEELDGNRKKKRFGLPDFPWAVRLAFSCLLLFQRKTEKLSGWSLFLWTLEESIQRMLQKYEFKKKQSITKGMTTIVAFTRRETTESRSLTLCDWTNISR